MLRQHQFPELEVQPTIHLTANRLSNVFIDVEIEALPGQTFYHTSFIFPRPRQLDAPARADSV